MKRSHLSTLIILSTLALVLPREEADLLVSSQTAPTADCILRYSDAGVFKGVFASGGGMADPLGLTFGPDGNLYVASANSGQVLRFEGKTGAFLGVFADCGAGSGPVNLTFGPDGNLYVSCGYNSILRFNGTTGASMGAFTSGGGPAYPRGLKFGPDGNLYVVNYNLGAVFRYDGATGAFIDTFVYPGSGGLATPSDLAFGPDGNLYVTGGMYPSPGVFRYHGATGAFLGQFAVCPYGDYPYDLAVGPDHNFYVVSQGLVSSVLRFDGQTGAYLGLLFPNGSGGLCNPFGLAFFPPEPPATNHPPVIECPDAGRTECGSPAVTTVAVGDADGDALAVVWTVNGYAVQTNMIPASQPPAPLTTNVSLAAELPLGTNWLSVAVNDSAGNMVSCSNTVTVVDTTPPIITAASVEPSRLWPPNHKMVPITVRAEATDTCGTATWRIIGVQSNESPDAHGDGHTSPDWQVTSDHGVMLRAERPGQGRDRVYSIRIQATDAAGNVSSPVILTVTVPH